MSCMLSWDPVYGYCKAREISDIVASGTWLLQGTNILRVGSFTLHMAVARPLNAMCEVIDGFVSDQFLISCRFVRGNMVSQNVR